MNSYNLYNTIRKLCSESDISVHSLEKNTQLSEGSIAKWSKSQPSIDKLVKIADYFDISLDYLASRTTIKCTSVQLLDDANLTELKLNMDQMSQETVDKLMTIILLLCKLILTTHQD